MRMDRRRVVAAGLGSLLGVLVGGREPAVADEAALWTALANGEAVAIMRHALAPGTGDPASFDLDDCATQRTLSEAGRTQARAIGERFRANGIDAAKVLSSRWCRSLETAELLGLGPVQAFPALDSFFGNRERGPAQTAALRDRLASWSGDRPLVLVTHQVNITALTGVFPASGEVVVIRPGGDGEVEVLGTLETDPE